MEERAKMLAELLKMLANDKRLLILCALAERPMGVGEIVEKLDSISQSGVSQHLAAMKARGILDCHKEGQSVTYFISDDKIIEVMAVLKKCYC